MMHRQDPTSAVVEYSDGSRKPVATDELLSFYDAVDSRDFWRGPSDTDEGSWIDPRSIERFGGRSEMERSLQRELCSWIASHEAPSLKRVMVIGDSIRMRISNATGYVRYAYEDLVGHVNLVHVPHNCGGTVTGRNLVENWISNKPDIVHYNAGLHDLALFRNSDQQPAKYRTVEQYMENLEYIFERIMSSGVKILIWALSTPVDDDWHQRRTRSTGARRLVRFDSDVQRYNDASIVVADRWHVVVNDLYTPLKNKGVRRVVLPDGVHLNYCGSQIAGDLVAKSILATL
jgi:lysophospholipase L1-like esterase